MDRFDNCWRWGGDSKVNPWYSTVHIIRQTQLNIWQDVLDKTAHTLNRFIAKRYPLNN